eukprot:scaffold607432_cov48-Prasinocladus_malaysianus.AAC.1
MDVSFLRLPLITTCLPHHLLQAPADAEPMTTIVTTRQLEHVLTSMDSTAAPVEPKKDPESDQLSEHSQYFDGFYAALLRLLPLLVFFIALQFHACLEAFFIGVQVAISHNLVYGAIDYQPTELLDPIRWRGHPQAVRVFCPGSKDADFPDEADNQGLEHLPDGCPLGVASRSLRHYGILCFIDH